MTHTIKLKHNEILEICQAYVVAQGHTVVGDAILGVDELPPDRETDEAIAIVRFEVEVKPVVQLTAIADQETREFRVYTQTGSMMIAAKSLEGAYQIAKRDGHDIIIGAV